MSTLIIGDIAGQYDAMVRLIDRSLKASKAPIETIVLVGDLVDRGPDSQRVVKFAFSHFRDFKVVALRGNHEDMMIECVLGRKWNYSYQGDWLANGGGKTELSYEGYDAAADAVLLDMLPLVYEEPGLIVSHAPLSRHRTLESIRLLNKRQVTGLLNFHNTSRERISFLWDRSPPKQIDDILQLYGHNGHYDRFCAPSGIPYAICLDDSRGSGSLCGYIYPEGIEVRQPYGLSPATPEPDPAG